MHAHSATYERSFLLMMPRLGQNSLRPRHKSMLCWLADASNVRSNDRSRVR